jgi:hypothetical protein
MGSRNENSAARAILEGNRASPDPQSLTQALETLNQLVNRALEAKEKLDTRAALIPPLVGTVAGITAGRLYTGAGVVAAASGLLAAIAAVAATVFALISLIATRYSIGPDPIHTALRTSDTLVDHKQATANELALAALDLKSQIRRKSELLNLSLGLVAASGLLLVVFAATGGIR